jgi:hypothetical protein
LAAVSTAFQSIQQLGLNKPDLARLNTWAADIAIAHRPGAPTRIDSKGALRIGRKGSLSVDRDGSWRDFEAGLRGFDAISLLQHLMPHASPVELRTYATTWLFQHPGVGTCTSPAPSDAERAERAARNAAYADEVLHRAEPVTPNTSSYKYLVSRGLWADQLPNCVVHLQVGRQDESAIVGVLTDADGDVVGVQLGHLDATARKSVYEPERNHYLLDVEKARGGAFRIPAAPFPVDVDVPELVRALVDVVLLVEGLEDALSLHQAFPYSAVWGIPGIGRLQHLRVKKGQKFPVVADGDADDSQAHTTLVKGLDHLLLEGAAVLLASAPPSSDANDLLQQGGVEAIHAVVAAAVPAKLSAKGRLAQVCRMPWVDFQLAVKELARELHTNSPFLVNQWKAAHQGDQSGQDPGLTLVPEDISWPAPVTDIATVCDTALTETQRYIVADPDDLAVLVIYGLTGHFVHHGIIRLTRCPRLELGGEDIDSGKTTALMIVGELLPRPLLIGGSITPPGFYRAVDAGHASVLIDEAESLLKSKDNNTVILMRILRSGSTRKFASVILTEPTPDGRHVARRFSTWAPIAYTVLGQLADAGMRSHCYPAGPGT